MRFKEISTSLQKLSFLTRNLIINAQFGMASGQNRPKVYVTRNIPKPALDVLNASCDVIQWANDAVVPRDVLLEQVQGKDGLFCLLTDKIDAQLLDAGKDLRVLGTMSVGLDHIDLSECRSRGLKVGYTPDVLTEATAELTVALLLCTARRLIEANQQVHSGGWGTWGPMWMCGKGIQDSNIGIVGLGRIGSSVAAKLLPFKPKSIFYTGPFEQNNQSIQTIFRGPVVDQEALYEALVNQEIRAAGLDVCTPEPLPPDHKLLALPNCVVLPHIASATESSRTAMAVLTARNIVEGLQGRPLPAPVIFES